MSFVSLRARDIFNNCIEKTWLRHAVQTQKETVLPYNYLRSFHIYFIVPLNPISSSPTHWTAGWDKRLFPAPIPPSSLLFHCHLKE